MFRPPLPGDRHLSRFRRLDFSKSPLLAFYEVTQACDLVCGHCRACAQSEPHPAELSSAESQRLIDQLGEFPNPPRLILTGGDPLKRADIFELIEYATNTGIRVSITPSATPLVTRDAIRQLRVSGIEQMAISIDGASAATHDALRGSPGSFRRSLEILADARAENIPLQVNTTLSPQNFDQIDELADLLAGLGIAMWSVFFLVPVGRAAGMPRLTPIEYEIAFKRLWRHTRRQPYAIKTTEAPHYRRYVIQHQFPRGTKAQSGSAPRGYMPMGVNDGRGVMFISHAGLIHPSGFLPIVCGMFPLDHVVNIYQNSPIFQGLRDADRLEGKCHVCEFRHLCGGSRARAYAVTGNLYAQEPDCLYIPVVQRS